MKSVKDKILKWFSINFPQLVFQRFSDPDDSTENGEKLVYMYKEDLGFNKNPKCWNVWTVGIKRTNATIFSISDTDDFDSIFKKYGGLTLKNSTYFNGRKFPKDILELELELMV